MSHLRNFLDSPKIPVGHTLETTFRANNPNITEDVLAGRIRTTRSGIRLVVDPVADWERFASLEQCREDSKQLVIYLQAELRKRELPILVRKHHNAKTKLYRKMDFLIRPPFVLSDEEKGPHNRMQWDPEQDVFILHFDDSHELQTVRFWYRKGEKPSRREKVALGIGQERGFFQANYGNWPVFAAKLVDVIEAALKEESATSA